MIGFVNFLSIYNPQTCRRLLYRFYEPDQGRISVGGSDVSAVDLDSLRKSIAIVPQDSVLFHDTIRWEL